MTVQDPPAAADKVISIAEARGLPLSTVVTIDGSVTVASGAFSLPGLLVLKSNFSGVV